MADDHTQRPFRSNPAPSHDALGGARGTSSANDPLAELARLIGQNDPFAEYGRQNAPAREAPPTQPSRGSSERAAHVAGDAGYIPPPPELHPAENAPSAAEHVPGAYQHGVPGYTGGEGGYEPESYHPNFPPSEGEDRHYHDGAPPRRRMGILAIAAVFALAAIGTAGAFGYRAVFGSSGPSGPPPVIKADTSPAKIVPAKKSKDAKNGKLIYDRVAEHGQGDKLVSREEQPLDVNNIKSDKPAGVILPHEQNGMPSGTIQPALGNGVIGVQPKKVHTVAIRPDGAVMADGLPNAAPLAVPASTAPAVPPASTAAPTKPAAPALHAAPAKPAPATHHMAARTPTPAPHHAAVRPVPRNAPLSLNPNAPVPHRPMRTARAVEPAHRASAHAAAAASGGYAVQVASRHNKADAEASLQSLKAKFGQQLGGHQTMIRRVDLGAKGVYYRAMVGPFSSSQAARQMCSRLKTAGGACFVQRI